MSDDPDSLFCEHWHLRMTCPICIMADAGWPALCAILFATGVLLLTLVWR